MNLKEIVSALIALALAIYSLYGAITQTGLPGWLIHFQDTLLGGHYTVYTAFLTWALLAIPAILGWRAASNALFGGRDTGFTDRLLFTGFARREASLHRGTTSRDMLIAWGVLVVATWAIGYGIYAWWAHGEREDAAATYAPVTLADGVAVPSVKGKHLALFGDVRTDRTLINGSGTSLLPVVPRGWRPGVPVTFVLKVGRLSELSARPRPSNTFVPAKPEPLLVRVSGDVPVPAAQEFKKIGVLLSEPSYLLRLVPSEDGKVLPSDSAAEAFQGFLYICGGLSVLTSMIMLGAWLMMKRERKLREKAV